MGIICPFRAFSGGIARYPLAIAENAQTPVIIRWHSAREYHWNDCLQIEFAKLQTTLRKIYVYNV
jgi:hypothetical protein